MTNVHACLVHESPECVRDLVANLRHLDPESTVLLYDGSRDGRLLRSGVLREDESVLVHPDPRPMRWGRLHDFALDSMRLALERTDFTTLTVVDSDQLGLRRGYAGFILARAAQAPAVGCFVSGDGGWQPRNTSSPVAQAAWRELTLWRPFLRRFPRGEELFPQWTFWPSTVFTRAAVEDMVELAGDARLRALLSRTRIWATEELVLPTMAALLGHEVRPSGSSGDFVRFRVSFTPAQVEPALERSDVFWLHPVARRVDDPLRAWVREVHGGYRTAVEAGGATRDGRMLSAVSDPAERSGRPPQVPLQTMRLLDAMEKVEGWLSRAEGDLLLGTAVTALARRSEPGTVVEIGSYCGRSTMLLGTAARIVAPDSRVFAVDPHEGTVGSSDQGIRRLEPTSERFSRTIRRAGVEDVVVPVRRFSYDVVWERPISMLFIDGLHDFASAAVDYSHFARHLQPGSMVAFHDYAAYYPGIQSFVDHLVATGWVEWVARAESLAVLRVVRSHDPADLQPILTTMESVEGWLERDEAAYLALLAASAAATGRDASMVEVGSYCGKGTVVLASVARQAAVSRVHAVDTFDGVVGATDSGLHRLPPTWDRFLGTLHTAGLDRVVSVHRGPTDQVDWDTPISLLVVDGLHDYAHARRDFDHFAENVIAGGVVAFHDHASYFPGVTRVVAELAASPEWQLMGKVGTLAAVRRVTARPCAQATSRGAKGRGLAPGSGVRTALPGGPSVVARAGRRSDGHGAATGQLVSCIMPTAGRPRFAARAVEYFLRQDYADRELVIVDDGPEPVSDVLPVDPRIRVVRLDGRRTIGAKRNVACEQARGRLVAHWDDDDWYAPDRLSVQVRALADPEIDVVGANDLLYLDPARRRGWRYTYPAGRKAWAHDPTLLLRRSLWESHPYPDLDHGVDSRWLSPVVSRGLRVLNGKVLYVGLVHPRNTSVKRTSGSWWREVPLADVLGVIGPDAGFYATEIGAVPMPSLDGTA